MRLSEDIKLGLESAARLNEDIELGLESAAHLNEDIKFGLGKRNCAVAGILRLMRRNSPL